MTALIIILKIACCLIALIGVVVMVGVIGSDPRR